MINCDNKRRGFGLRKVLHYHSLVAFLIISPALHAEEKTDVAKGKKVYDVGCLVRTGSTLEYAANNMAYEYMKIQPEAKISTKTTGAYFVWKAVIEKTSQLGITVGKGPAPELEKLLHDEKENLIIKKFGTVGMAVIVSKNSPVSDISIDDIRKIFSGEISNWSEIFGPDKPIHVYGPSPNEFVTSFIKSEVLLEGQLLTPKQISKPSSTVAQIIAEDPDGIAFVSLAGITKDVKALSIDHVEPSQKNVIAKKYPLTSEGKIIYLDSANHTTHDFAKFLLTRKQNKKWLDELQVAGVEEVED